MEIIYVDPKLLRPAEYNPRQMTKPQHDALLQSLNTFGFVEPLIVNNFGGREQIVVGGHQRLAIALEMGLDRVPVVYVTLDEQQERELNLRLNKNNGEWDRDLLAHFDMEELQIAGFTELETAKLLDLEVDQEEKVVCGECGRKYKKKKEYPSKNPDQMV